MNRGVLPVLMSVIVTTAYSPFAFAADSNLNFKIYSPDAAAAPADDADAAAPSKSEDTTADTGMQAESPKSDTTPDTLKTEAPAADAQTEPAATAGEPALQSEQPSAATADAAPSTDASAADAASTDAAGEKSGGSGKVLQGYIREVPKGTKVPIIMDTAVDSDTSQEGDEFAARTSEDMSIDGTVVVPAGSVIKGRIAQLNAPKHLNRTGSVALKFDTVTTPDNRQIPLVANLVARGGVVHARRGMRDIAMDTGIFVAPTAVGSIIGAIAGNSSKSLGAGSGLLIGAGVGAAVGAAILLAKKGKKIDVRPGDELRIELAEDLRMPMM